MRVDDTLNDWFTSLYKRRGTDVLLLDFQKAFDTVPHNRLLQKLNYYGICGNYYGNCGKTS